MADNNIVIKITAQSDLSKAQRDLQEAVDHADALEKEYYELSEQMRNTARVMGKNSEEYKKLARYADDNRKSITALTKGIKLTDMSMNALRQRASMLRNMLDATSKAADPKGFARLQKQLEKTESAMQKVGTESIASKAKHALAFKVVAAGTAAYYALRNAISDGIRTIVEFDKANANLASIMGKSPKQIKALTAEAKRLGATTSYTASQMIELETEMAKLGFTEGQILKSTEAVQRFATATGSDLASAASLAGATLRAFELDASEMERVVSTMAVATTKSALDFSALDTAMSQVAPVAKSLGFSIEDTTALLGQLANSGMDASTAATSTRNILLNLSNDSGKLAKALGRPVKSLDDLVPALQDLQKKGVDLSEVLELTDKRSVAAFSTFMSGTETLKQLKKDITGATEEFKEMEKTRLDTVAGSMDLLKSAWDGLMLTMSGSTGIMKDVLDWVTGVISNITEFIEGGGFKEWVTYVLGDEDVKHEIESARRAREAKKQLADDIAKFQKMSLEQAKAYHAKLLKEEDLQEEHLQVRAEAAYARGNKEEGDFYTQQLEFLENYRSARTTALAQMEKDDLEVRERARKKEEEDRKQREKERLKELKKNREIALQEQRNRLQAVSVKTNKSESDYADEIALAKKIAELEAQVQIDALSKLEMGERAYNAQVVAIRQDRDAKIKKIEDDELQRIADNAKVGIDILVQRAEQETKALTGEESIEKQLHVWDAYYKARAIQMDENASREIEEIERSTDTEEVKAAKIEKINADLQASLEDIAKDGAQKRVDIQSQALTDLEIALAQAEDKVSKAQTGGQKIDALKEQFDAQKALYAKQKEQLDAQYAAKLISYQDYKKQEWEITKATTDAEVAYMQEKMQTIADGFQQALGYMQQISDMAFEALGSQVQAELDALEEGYTTDWQEAQKSADKKYMTQKEYEKKKAALEEKQAKYAKAQALINAGINTALAITSALTTVPFIPAGLAAAVIAGAMGAAQIGIIASKPLAQYAKGRKGGKGEYALVGEKGAELMYVPQGASIVPHDKLADQEEWGRFGVPRIDMPEMPVVNADSMRFVTTTPDGRLTIDYDKLGEAVARNIPQQKAVTVNVDRSGVHVSDGANVHTYLNAKYNGVWN